jgi:hypothetical protein
MRRRPVEIRDEQDPEMLYLWACNVQLEAINDFIMGPGLQSLIRSLHADTMPKLLGVVVLRAWRYLSNFEIELPPLLEPHESLAQYWAVQDRAEWEEFVDRALRR